MKRFIERFSHLSLFPIGAAALFAALFADGSEARAPDIVFILADDMGYSDAGCFGGEMATPALDQLAAQGLRLTQCFNGGMCVVSRTSFLTGQWWPSGTRDFTKVELLSERLKAGGYRTGLVGKWHLKGHPMDHGFDHFFGFLGGFSSHYSGGADYRLDRQRFTDFGKDFYSSDAFSARAVEFIEKSVEEQPNSPFFLYLSYQAPHNPLQAPAEDIMRQRGNYRTGWQAVREARFARQQKLGIVSKEASLPNYPKNLPPWDSLSDAQVELEDLRMATYAAMIERMDAGIGKVIDTLKKKNRLENTVVIFLSDNGADPFSVVDQAMLKRGLLPGEPGSNYQPGVGWAYASVTPWRMYKISQHGGGVASGGIFHWPAGMKSPGSISHVAVHFTDLMPTLLASAGLDVPELDGESFLPLLQGRTWQRKEAMFFQYMDNRAIRTTDWTLAEIDGQGWELFDTRKDPLETKNLASAHPEVLKQLSERWESWWTAESGKKYVPTSTATGPHYAPQGDRGSGRPYKPSAMPDRLKR